MSRAGERPAPRAVALGYDGRGAPRVVAKGDGALGRRIIEIAREHGVPLREEPELAGALARIDLGDEIPPDLFVAVAQVLAFAYRVSGRQPPRRPSRERTRATATGADGAG